MGPSDSISDGLGSSQPDSRVTFPLPRCSKADRHLTRLPGCIDIHVHTRDPGDTHKEDFDSCTAAALAGGVTMICAMPNTSPALVDMNSLDLVEQIAIAKARCDYALYVGAYSENTETVCELAPRVAALKMFIGETFTTFKMENMELWLKHIENWPASAPVCVFGDAEAIAAVILFARFHDKHIHICHVISKEEIEVIKAAKIQGIKVTCEVSVVNLFLCRDDLKKLGIPEPDTLPLVGTAEDREALWNNLDYIDCFCTDHAPHTAEEIASGGSCAGFPCLETALPLLFNAVIEGKLALNKLIDKFYKKPREIFNLPDQADTYVEIDPEEEWIIPEKMNYTKCDWNPFTGTKIKGAIRRVILRGKVVYEDGNIFAPPGFGKNVRQGRDQEILKTVADLPICFSSMKLHGLEGKHILGPEEFTQESLSCLYDISSYLKSSIINDIPLQPVLRGRILACAFYEPSTKARCSFACAMQLLGGGVIYDDIEISSSIRKGETVEDIIISLESCADIIAMRHPVTGISQRAKIRCTIPIINCGDGVGEHPTQALLSAFTIREELGTISGLTIAMVGDLKNGRTVHSVAKLMSLYNVNLIYVSPRSLRMPKTIYDFVASHGVQQSETSSLESILPDIDVLYMTRIQRERFTNPVEYDQHVGRYIITPQLMTKAKKRMIVMHPLPRVYEIRPDFDSDPRAAYFRQAENALYVRMGLLAMVLGVSEGLT